MEDELGLLDTGPLGVSHDGTKAVSQRCRAVGPRWITDNDPDLMVFFKFECVIDPFEDDSGRFRGGESLVEGGDGGMGGARAHDQFTLPGANRHSVTRVRSLSN